MLISMAKMRSGYHFTNNLGIDSIADAVKYCESNHDVEYVKVLIDINDIDKYTDEMPKKVMMEIASDKKSIYSKWHIEQIVLYINEFGIQNVYLERDNEEDGTFYFDKIQ